MNDPKQGSFEIPLNGTHESILFNHATALRFYRNTNDSCFVPHWHLPGEIIVPLSNIYEVTVGGDTLILQPGDILLIGPSELHSIRAPSTGVRYIVNFDSNQFSHIRDMNVLFTLLMPYCLIRAREYPELSARLQTLLEDIEQEYKTETPYNDGIIYASLLTFFVLLGRYFSGSSTEKFQGSTQSKQKEYHSLFLSVCGYIQQHCAENLSLEQMAQNAGFSKYHFCRLFKEFTGTTFHDFLTNSRIQTAKTLLDDSSVSITEISMRAGFNSLSTFNRIFKAQLGCTPSEYRKLNTPDPTQPKDNA